MHDKKILHDSSYSCLKELFHSCVLSLDRGSLPGQTVPCPHKDLHLLLSTSSFPYPFFYVSSPKPLEKPSPEAPMLGEMFFSIHESKSRGLRTLHHVSHDCVTLVTF